MGIGYGIGPIAILIAAVVISQFLLVKTRPGRRMYFLGGNEEAARLTGVRTKFYRSLTFMLSGLFAALGAIVMVSRVGSASPTAGTGYELDVIAGIVVGGIALSGGKGSIVNAFIGTVAIGVLSNALNLLGVSSYPQLIVKGALIIIAVLIDTMTKNRSMQNATYKAKLKKRTELG
jgi:ribose transport system permease protein